MSSGTSSLQFRITEDDGATVGLEVEFHLYNRGSLQLDPVGGGRFLKKYKELRSPGIDGFVPDTKMSLAEANLSPVYLADLPMAIGRYRSTLARLGQPLGLVPVFAGLPLNAPPEGIAIVDAPAYQAFRQVYEPEMAQNETAGLHVHIGIKDRQLRTEVYNRIRGFLPLLTAMSAGVAWHRGLPTGPANARMQSYGHHQMSIHDPGPFESEAQWQRWCEKQVRSFPALDSLLHTDPRFAAKKAVNLIYPLMRMHPDHPTIEFRMPALGLSGHDEVLIAGLISGLVRQIVLDIGAGRPSAAAFALDSKAVPSFLPWLLAAQNDGSRAKVVDPFAANPNALVVDVLRKTVQYIAPALKDLGVPDGSYSQLAEAWIAQGDSRDRSVLAVREKLSPSSAEALDEAVMRRQPLPPSANEAVTAAVLAANYTHSLVDGNAWLAPAIPGAAAISDVTPLSFGPARSPAPLLN